MGESISHLDGDGEVKKEPEPTSEFIYNEVGLTDEEAAILLAKVGKNELPENVTPDWKIIGRSLIQPMPLMIWAAAIIEAAIENWPDMVALMISCVLSHFCLGNFAGNSADQLFNQFL